MVKISVNRYVEKRIAETKREIEASLDRLRGRILKKP